MRDCSDGMTFAASSSSVEPRADVCGRYDRLYHAEHLCAAERPRQLVRTATRRSCHHCSSSQLYSPLILGLMSIRIAVFSRYVATFVSAKIGKAFSPPCSLGSPLPLHLCPSLCTCFLSAVLAPTGKGRQRRRALLACPQGHSRIWP